MSSTGEWTFRVRLSDVSLKSVAATADRPAPAYPYFRCDFDGKIMQSELCQAPGDATWAHKATFDYRLDENNVTEVVTSLASRTAVFEVFFTDGTKHVLLGRATVDLYTLATGASTLQLGLTAGNGGSVVGMLHATLQMEHLSVIETSVASLSLHNLPEPLQVELSYGVLEDQSTAPVQSKISASSRDPTFDRCPCASYRSSLRVLLSNTLRVTFLDVTHNGAVIGSIDIPFAEIVLAAGNCSTTVKRNLYADASYRRSFTAHVVATVSVTNLPTFAQLSTGLNNSGQVHGKPLIDGLMMPPKYSKFPSRLPDYAPTARTTNATPATRRGDPSVTANMPPADMPITEAQLSSGRPGDVPSLMMTQSYAQPSNMYVRSPMRATASTRDAQPAARTLSPPRQHPAARSAIVESSSSVTMMPRSPMPPSARPHPAGAGLPAITALQRTRSPIANAATILQQQHDEALAAIEAQRRRVAGLTDDLQARTHGEQEAERKRADMIVAEDRTLQSRHEAATRNLEELRRALDESDADSTNAKRTIAAERAELESELEDLAATEAQLQSFLASLQRHSEEDARVREIARLQALEARERLDSDYNAIADFESRVALRNRQRAPSPHLPAPSSPVNKSLYAAPAAPSSAVAAMPSSYGGAASSFAHTPNHSSSAGTSSVTSGQLLDAITTGNEAAFLRGVAVAPELLLRDHVWLLRACSAPGPREDIVAAILRQRPELLHMIDPLSANTPLHAACSAQRPNAGVVALLLLHGANPHAFNVNGLTPMHLALLNVNDMDHTVKRALTAKAGVGILNQPSSSGETGAHLCASNDRHLPSLRFLSDSGAHMNAIALLLRDGRPVQATPRDKAVWSGAEAEGCRRFLERF